MVTAKTYIAGIYVRLSNDDERAGESVSIENQKMLLMKYVEEQGWELKEIYIDDGWSGTNFDRPALQRMLHDAREKRINLIIVKDLSRLGRNYIEVGRLTDEILPELGCRFIALNDSVDTLAGENDMMVYKNLFNEFFSRDTSKKVRAVKKACAKGGKYMGTYAPYGYLKNPANKHVLIPDEELAPIVKKMFEMRVHGKGFHAIADALNEEQVPSPKEVYYRRADRANPCNNNHLWNSVTVRKIIRNEVYIGHMVQGKVGTKSYKSRKIVNKPEEEWIRVENTHPPLIDMKTWDTVCALDEKNYKPRETVSGNDNMFGGLLKCADCGYGMRYHAEKGIRKDESAYEYISYLCGNYARSGKHACSIHTISEPTLIELLLHDIREKAQWVSYDEDRVVDYILHTKNKQSASLLSLYKKELDAALSRLSELERIVQSLYEDKVKGNVPDAMWKNLIQKYEQERIDKSARIPILRNRVSDCEQQWKDVSRWAHAIRQYGNLESLNQETLLELIDRIEVSEARREGGKRICSIQIIYRFVGDLGAIATDVEARHGQAV